MTAAAAAPVEVAPADVCPADRYQRRVTAGLLVALGLLAVVLRVSMWGFESGDVRLFVAPWRQAYLDQGAWQGLGDDFANYTPPYLYLLALSSLLPLEHLTAVKALALLLDAGLVGSVAVYLRTLLASWRAALVGAGLVLYAPTVLLNGALWGQVDAMWVAPVVLSLACVERRRPWAAMALYGLALAVKLQAVFLAPVFLLLLLTRRLPVRSVLAAGAAYVLAFLPAVLAGRPLSVLVDIYREQSGTYDPMTLNAANLYQLLAVDPEVLSRPAVLFTAALVLLLALHVVVRDVPPSPLVVLRLALLSALLCPFFLPHMHERYFFAADVLVVLYAVALPSRWPVAVVVLLASTASYQPFLFELSPPVPFWVLAVGMLGALLAVVLDLVRRPLDEGLADGSRAAPAGSVA